MPSDLQRVAQSLVDCLDQMPGIAAHLQRLAARCRENAGVLAGFASANPAARVAALQLDAAARACEEAANMASVAPQKARQWAEQMVRGARTSDGSPSGGRRDAADRSRPTGSGASPLDVAEILNRIPKQESFGRRRGKTRGLWTDAQGDEHDLVSGADEYQRRAAAWVKQLRMGPPPHTLVIDSHVEIKFAMLMRARGLRDETIIINNPPCSDEWGCDANLERFLAPGAKLTVIAPGFKKIYRGKDSKA